MAAVKLTHAGMTRRVLFPDEHPSWTDLSQRVQSIFEIPAASVALSYVDPDGDTMYINSNDELFDFFHTEPSHPHNKPPLHRFTVHDMRQVRSPGDDFEHVPGSNRHEDDGSSSSASSASSSEMESNAMPDLGERRPSRSMGMGIGGMGIGFAPFEMMFGPAASAANVKSPSQGHISPVPTEFAAAAAAEAGQTRSQFGRTVSSSSARSESTVGDRNEGPTIHIQQPSTASVSEMEHDEENMYRMHPTPALYHDVASFVHALSGAVNAHPEVSHTFHRLVSSASSGAYWDAIPPPSEIHEASARNLLGAVDTLLRTFFPPPPPQTPTQAALATPAYTAANFELPESVIADETPVASRFQTPVHVPVSMPYVASPAMTASTLPSSQGRGPAIRPVLDTVRADRSSVRSDTDAGSIVSGGMGSPVIGSGPAWRFAGRSGGGMAPGGGGNAYQPHPALNNHTGAVVPALQPDLHVVPEAAKYVESRVRLEHMKEMYKQTKEEYRREREERKREREEKKRERLLGPPPPKETARPASPQGDMFNRLNEALTQIPGRVGMNPDHGHSGLIPPAPASTAGSIHTNETAIRTRQQLNQWLTEQLGDMGFTVTTHPQVGRLVRDATRPYAANAEAANENALLEGLLAQLVPTASKA